MSEKDILTALELLSAAVETHKWDVHQSEKLHQVYVLMFPPDGSAGMKAVMDDMVKHMNKEREARRQLQIAIVSALASLGVALIALFKS